MKHGIDTKHKAEDGGQGDHRMALLSVKEGLESLPVPKQVQDKNYQDHIFNKRFPWCQFNGVTEASAVRYFVEVSRVECEEGKKHDQAQQYFCRDRHPIVDQDRNAQHDLEDNQEHTDLQRIGLEDEKERTKILTENLKILLQFYFCSDGIVKLDQPRKNKQASNKKTRKVIDVFHWDYGIIRF